MEGDLSSKDVYRQHFLPKAYLKKNFSFDSNNPESNDLLEFALKSLHKAFTLDGIKGETLIDIGSGPSIYQFLSSCESFREIIATDYSDHTLEEMLRWLKKEPDAFDWSPVVKYVCELEGDREKWQEKEEKVRRTVRRVLQCDATLANPLAPLELPPVCCVTSQLCLEAACHDLSTYRSAVKNIGSLVKPGGHLVMVVALKASYFILGQQRYCTLSLEQEEVNGALREAAFEIVWSDLKPVQFSWSDNKERYAVIAQRCAEDGRKSTCKGTPSGTGVP